MPEQIKTFEGECADCLVNEFLKKMGDKIKVQDIQRSNKTLEDGNGIKTTPIVTIVYFLK